MKQSETKINEFVLHKNYDASLHSFSGQQVVTNKIAQDTIQIIEVAAIYKLWLFLSCGFLTQLCTLMIKGNWK